MAPGVNRLGRSTGTVPKTKTPNNSGRENSTAVCRTPRSNIPNNLSSQDWQSGPSSSSNRTRKTSNTKTSLLDYYDVPEERLALENSRFLLTENQEPSAPVNRSSLEVNGVEPVGSSSSVRRDCVRRPLRNVMPDNEDKSNISKMNGAVLKTDGSRCNELRLKLEESQKKLQAMQEHQAVLQALQQQTQQQLLEARAAQSSLLARTAASAAATAASSVSDDEHSPETLRGNLDVIRDRLYALQMYEPRNPDKLQELQSKKERMDHLVAEFQTESNGVSGAASLIHSSREKSCDSSKDGSIVGDGDGQFSDIECDVQKVKQKMAQLSVMKAQLRRLQNLVDTGLQDTESANGEDACLIQPTENDGDEEEAINLRRQRQGKCRSVSRTNSTSSTATKPDNISQASLGNVQEAELRIERKTLKLKEAKSRLYQLQNLLTTVMDMRSRGEPVPEHYLQMLEEETTRADQEQAAEIAASQESRSQHLVNVDREREGASALVPTMNGCSASTHESSEVTIEMVQAMALELQTQTQCLREEKERLMLARQEIGKSTRDLPFREKKTNTQMLLQAKRRELEELMRKDKGQSSAVNQDICSEAGKSETAGFSYVGEGTSAATWGGSTQGTLDDLAEREDDVREQSAGYSSDEAQDDESNQHYLSPQMNHSHPQRNTTSSSNNNANNNNTVSMKKEALVQSTSTNREALSMSVESGGFGGSQSGHGNSNTGSISGTFPQPQMISSISQQRPGPRNVWRKSSTDSSATLPRAVWTPGSQHPNVDDIPGNVNTPIVNTSANQNENESNASNISQINQSQSSSSLQNNWWQQQAMQLQSQLDATTNLYQSLLLEHQQQQQNLSCWPQPPALAQMPSLRPPLPTASPDAFYQQLLAATQFQQQQLLLTTVNQCCHLLWMQQREMTNLRGVVMSAAAHGTTGPPWLQQGSSGPAAGLLSAHASSASPVPALNNQVPPGNRANNYWDNFRSYSRQNLLSTSTKSNEGVSHSPSPLVDRSRNTLRNPASFGQHPTVSQPTSFPMPEQGLPLNLSRKEKLNIERYHSMPENYSLPSGGIPDMAELHYQSHLPNNQYHNSNMHVEHSQLGARALPSTLANNNSSLDSRGTSSWHNRPTTRTYRSQRGVNYKRKNPRPSTSVATEPALSSSSVASTPQDRSTRRHREALSHRSGCSLFDVLSESVYTEVAALIAVNESRPHFLIQLFRDLQMVSSDPLRQRTLQSIHELVSRYLAEANRAREDSRECQSTKICQPKDPLPNDDSLISSDEDENSKMVSRNSIPLQSMHAPLHNGVWGTNEEITLPSILQQGHNEWELEAVLEDLLPFLKGHLEEICSPALLDAVRQQAVQLMLAQTQAHVRPTVPGSSHQPAGGYFQGQLDALLEDGLNKFQGCRLRDVCEDLLMVITDILQSELTFLKLVDTVRREVDDSSEDASKIPPASDEPANSVHPLQLSVESVVQVYPPADINSQNHLESLGSAEGYNGDLAEADQSHHEEAIGGVSPQHGEGEVAGAVVPEDSDDDGLLEIMQQNDILSPEENQDGLAVASNREDCEDQAKTEAEDEWAVEQDREQGLDRVPTRLTEELEGQVPSQTANHSDGSLNP